MLLHTHTSSGKSKKSSLDVVRKKNFLLLASLMPHLILFSTAKIQYRKKRRESGVEMYVASDEYFSIKPWGIFHRLNRQKSEKKILKCLNLLWKNYVLQDNDFPCWFLFIFNSQEFLLVVLFCKFFLYTFCFSFWVFSF